MCKFIEMGSMILNLAVGDEDGRVSEVSYEIYDVQNSYTVEALHGIGCDILGASLRLQCDKYADNSLSSAFIGRLQACSVPLPSDPEDMTLESFAELYLEIAKLALPSLTWSKHSSEVSTLYIGGFGIV